jgi:hypothetical protein
MNEENLTPLIKALILWPPSEEEDIHEVIAREDINELCCNGETFPYLYLIKNDEIYQDDFRDNPKLNLNNTNKYGETVLMALAKQGEYVDSKILIERGADWKMKDDKGMTAMDYAREYGLEEDPDILGVNEDGEAQYRDPILYRYYQHLSGTLDPLLAISYAF